MFINNEFGIKLSKLRKERKLTQEELGELLGINGKSVSKWERGITMPSVENILKICVLFRISSDELFLIYKNTSLSNDGLKNRGEKSKDGKDF